MFRYNGRTFFLSPDKSGVLTSFGSCLTVFDSSGERVTDTLSDLERSAALGALVAGARAESYLWGRQDATESERDTDKAIEFGRAYGAHVHRYLVGHHWTHENLQRAYELWSAGDLDENQASEATTTTPQAERVQGQ